MTSPKVLFWDQLDKNEKNKIRRVCIPKPGSGNLEVPENIFEMWQDAAKGRETLYRMWAKSGGVKVGMLVGKVCAHDRSRKAKGFCTSKAGLQGL